MVRTGVLAANWSTSVEVQLCLNSNHSCLSHLNFWFHFEISFRVIKVWASSLSLFTWLSIVGIRSIHTFITWLEWVRGGMGCYVVRTCGEGLDWASSFHISEGGAFIPISRWVVSWTLFWVLKSFSHILTTRSDAFWVAAAATSTVITTALIRAMSWRRSSQSTVAV